MMNMMGSFSCNEPAAIKPGDPVVVDTDEGDYWYCTFEPLCKMLAKSLTVDVKDITGKSSVCVSTLVKNPAAFAYEWQDSNHNKAKVFVINRNWANMQHCIGVTGDQPRVSTPS